MATNGEYTLVSINQLDMDAIADYIVSDQKLVYRTDTAGTKAEDVDCVGGVSADMIARIPEGTTDRNTVENALNLGGRPAADYMTRTEGNVLNSIATDMKNCYGDDIKDLRDELYQLKNQLAKGGFVRNDGQYKGFHDLFQAKHPVHEDQMLCEASTERVSTLNQIQITDPDVFAKLDIYDFIALRNTTLDNIFVKQIIAKENDGETLTLDSDIDTSLQSSVYEIYKSSGCIQNGCFEFAKPPGSQIGSNEYYSGVSDDSYNVYKKLENPKTGFAYNFKIPEGKTGYLSEVEICLRAYGAPGSLMAYIIDERDLPNFKNPAQAENDYLAAQAEHDDSWYFFAKSQPLFLSADLGKRYCQFSFEQDGQYPLIPVAPEGQIVRYILIVELQSGDNENYYNMLFLQHRNTDGSLTDLQLNNTTYYYTQRSDTATSSALTTDNSINNFDMYYQVHTLENVENDEIPNSDGLYSAIMYSQQNLNLRRMRVTMRIRREGLYCANITENPTSLMSQALTLQDEDADSAIRTVDDLCLMSQIMVPKELREGDGDLSKLVPVAIGDMDTTVRALTSNSITVNTPCLVFQNDPVYRIGYWVAIKASTYSFDRETGILSHSTPVRYNLPLTKIIRDINRADIEMSDRLIFEADIPEEDQNIYNYFEIQVYWENKQISSYYDVRRAQMGAIKELTVSFDRYF